MTGIEIVIVLHGDEGGDLSPLTDAAGRVRVYIPGIDNYGWATLTVVEHDGGRSTPVTPDPVLPIACQGGCGRSTMDPDRWDPEVDTGRVLCNACWDREHPQ